MFDETTMAQEQKYFLIFFLSFAASSAANQAQSINKQIDHKEPPNRTFLTSIIIFASVCGFIIIIGFVVCCVFCLCIT